MATINSGGTASFSMDPFDYMDVTASRPCIGTIAATSGAPNLQPSQSFGVQNRRYGPFGVPMTIVIAVASGTMTYAITEGSGGGGGGTGIFIGPYAWDARPTTGLTVGDTFRAADVGSVPGTLFMWTGSAWRNLSPYTIGSNAGSVASPVATISGATSGVFTIPTPISIPADLFAAGSRASLVAVLRKNGGTATNTWNAYLGTAGGITDSLIRTEAGAINSGRTARFDVDIWFPSTTVATGVQNVAPQANGTNAVTDVSTNINTAAAMSVTIAVASGNVGDSYQLLSCGLVVGVA